MAFVEKPTATLTYVMLDESGSRATCSFDVPETTLADAAITAAGVLRPLIEALTDCAVVSYSLTYSSADDAPAAPAAGSRVERKGVFTFRTAAGKTAIYQIPGIADSVVEASGRIDDDNVAVAAFIAAVTAIDAVFCDSNGQDLRSLKSAYERYRSTSRQQLPANRFPD
jgi:hypothetical protein